MEQITRLLRNIKAYTLLLLLCTSCLPVPPPSEIAYKLESIEINGSVYECWNHYDIHLVSERILNVLVQLSGKDMRESMRLLKDNPVGICKLPVYIPYEYCGNILTNGACYYNSNKVTWLIGDALVHELIHHMINVVYQTDKDLEKSRNHTHDLFNHLNAVYSDFKNETGRL